MRAEEYAPQRLKEAEEALQRAVRAIAKQKARLFFLRDYSQTWSALATALEAASLAKLEAVAYRDTVHREAETGIKYGGAAIEQARRKTAELPLDRHNRIRLVQAEIALSEAQSALLVEDFLLARAKAWEATERAMEVHHRSDAALESYLTPRAFVQWKRWAAETISWSDQQDTYALIIDKVHRRCDIYFDGELQNSYPVDLGYGPLGDKLMRGDAVTPEGKYQVVAKRDIGDSPYRRSLVINYPTQEDSTFFQQAKAQGLLPEQATLGGQIEIHGGGVRGTNWTFGCIALRDADMDQVFRHAGAGTPVTIVGTYKE